MELAPISLEHTLSFLAVSNDDFGDRNVSLGNISLINIRKLEIIFNKTGKNLYLFSAIYTEFFRCYGKSY